MTADLPLVPLRPDLATDQSGSDFAELRRRITAAGLLERRPGYYVIRIGTVAAATVLAWATLVTLGSTWWALLLAPVLAVLMTQLALVAHDVAHRQVFGTRRASERAGILLGNLGVGMSYGWWMDKHTRHHANPNHEDRDPDVAPDLILWSRRQARASTGLARAISRVQGRIFVPLLLLEALNLHASSVRAVVAASRSGSVDGAAAVVRRNLGLEAAALTTHLVALVTIPFVVLSPLQAVIFLAVQQGLFGLYLGATFAPNHKGMPMLTDADELDYLRRQVLTSRNVTGGPLRDLALGGLNHQIEHHLFPSMPTPQLPRAKPIVRAYCAEIGVPYVETGLWESYRLGLAHLHDVGVPTRADRRR